LIRGVKIVTPEGQITSRFVSVKIGPHRQYEDIRVVVTDIDKWQAVLTDMAQRLGEAETTLNGLVSIAETAERGETVQDLQRLAARLRNRLEEAAQLPL
jgi:UDP-N-acetylglucosamine enolpyruvyl transferase